MNTRKRPTTVAAISWFLIITGGWAFLSIPLFLNSPASQQLLVATKASAPVVALLTVLSGGTNITSGLAMLRGRNWGRRLYLVVNPALLLISMVLSNFVFAATFFIGAVAYAVSVVLLTHRSVSDYFAGSTDTESSPSVSLIESPEQPPANGKKIASVILLVLGGFSLITCFMSLLMIPAVNFVTRVVIAGVYAALACAFIIPGIFLWGRRRWAVVLGTLTATIGGGLLVSSLMLAELTSIPELGEQFASVGSDMAPAFRLVGIPMTLMGGLLILLQRRNDSKTKLAAP